MEAYKANSARQAMFNEFKINNSFTLENSFFMKNSSCGCEGNDTQGSEKKAHEGDSDDLESMKADLCVEPSSPSKKYDKF